VYEISRRQLLAGVAGATILPATGMLAGAAPAEAAPPASALPSRADVLAVAQRVNDQWIGAHSNPGNNHLTQASRRANEPVPAGGGRGQRIAHDCRGSHRALPSHCKL